MAIQTLKTGTHVTVKDNGTKGTISAIENGHYKIGKSKLLYSASDLVAEKTTPVQKKRTPINQVSAPQQKLNAIYSILRREWMPHNKTCVARFAGCTHKATEVHHMYKRTGFWLIVVKLWMPICRTCHRHATKHSKEAIAAGVSVSRLIDIPYSFTQHERKLMQLHNINAPT